MAVLYLNTRIMGLMVVSSTEIYRNREKKIIEHSLLKERIAMYHTVHYDLRELVWRDIYSEYQRQGKLWILWRKFDPLALMVIDRLRHFNGKILINNWHLNGVNEYCGARPNVIPDGHNWAYDTTHHDWNTFDLHPLEISHIELYNNILDNQIVYPEITGIENIELTNGWVHVTTSNFGLGNKQIRIIGE